MKIISDFEFDIFGEKFIRSATHKPSGNKLPKTPARIIYELLNSLDQPKEKIDIANSVWGKSDYFTLRSMDVHIVMIRKFLKENTDLSIKRAGVNTIKLQTKGGE